MQEDRMEPFKKFKSWGFWVAPSVKRLTPAQVMIKVVEEFALRVGLCADSSEPKASFRFCVSVYLRPSPMCALSLPLSLK